MDEIYNPYTDLFDSEIDNDEWADDIRDGLALPDGYNGNHRHDPLNWFWRTVGKAE